MIQNWPTTDHHSGHAIRRGRWLALCAMLVFAATMWLAIPHGIGFSWRECDTQAISRNFLRDGFDPLRPRIDWRGDTDGAVECEFPLYQLSIASIMTLIGEAEWPGRLLALLATIWASLSLHRLLEMRAGPSGALAGLLVFLVSGSSVMIATRIMPDAFSLALSIASLAAFVRYLAFGSSLSLGLSVAALTFAALQKPPALQIGMLMFGWTVFLAPRRLREPRLWLGFTAILVTVAAWLMHGKSLYEETGLTFGVVSGGDTKFPDLEHLLSPKIHAQLAWTSLQYGLSALGSIALLVMLLRRRLDAADIVILATVALSLYGSLRYSYHHKMGPHYHVFASFAGAWLVARAWPARASSTWWAALLTAVMLQGAWRVQVERTTRTGAIESPLMDIAATIRRLSSPSDLVIVRSQKPRHDKLWQRRNNYENPAMFYQAELHGWVLPADGFELADLKRLRTLGARLIYNPMPGQTSEAVKNWLDKESETVINQPRVQVHRLRSTE
jgi:hypothetical protein